MEEENSDNTGEENPQESPSAEEPQPQESGDAGEKPSEDADALFDVNAPAAGEEEKTGGDEAPAGEEKPKDIGMAMDAWAGESKQEGEEEEGGEEEEDDDHLPADGEVPQKEKKKKVKKKVSKGSQDEAKEAIRAVGDFIKAAPKNLNLEESKDLLKRALSSMKLKAWSKATEYAQQAQDRADAVRNLYMEVADEYTKLERKFVQLHDAGISVPSLDQRFFDIQNLIREGSLEDAKEGILDLKTDLILVVPVYEDYLLLLEKLQGYAEKGYNIPMINKRSQKIFDLINTQKLDEAKQEMGSLDEDVGAIIPVYDGYRKLDGRIKDAVGRAITIEGVDTKVTQIIERMNEADWPGAGERITEANKLIDSAMDADKTFANQAHELLTGLYETLKAAPAHLNLDGPTRMYQTAKQLFEAKSYQASLGVSRKAEDQITDIRQNYNQVLDAISTAKQRIQETRDEEGYADIEFAMFETMLIQAKQALMGNDFDGALHLTQDCLGQLEDAKKPIFEQLVHDVGERFKILGKEVMKYEPLGIDVADAKDLMISIQGDIGKAQDYGAYSRTWWDMDKLEDVLEEARAEFTLMSDVPKFITIKLKETKNQLNEMRDAGASDLAPLYGKLDECLDDYAMAGSKEDQERTKLKVTELVKAVYKTRDSSVAMKNKRAAIDKVLNTAMNGIRKLKGEGYDVSRLQSELDNKHNLVENAKTMKGLEFLHDEIGKWVTSINDIFEEEPDLYNQKETARGLIVEINKHYRKLQDEDVALAEVKPKVELLNRMAPEANTLTEFRELTSKAQPLLTELETMFEQAQTDKEKKDNASQQIEALKKEVEGYAGKADLTLITHSLTLGEVALVSKQYVKALEFVEQCRKEIDTIKGADGSLVEVEISTENLQPNMWDQTKLKIRNTGMTVLSNIQINIEGPVEIRRIKPVEKLALSQELVLDVGVMFKGAGRLPLDLKISAVRLLDNSHIDIQKDLWVTMAAAPVTPGQAPAQSPAAAAPRPAGPASQEDEIIVKLEKLAALKEKGIISEFEFEKKKKELLDQY